MKKVCDMRNTLEDMLIFPNDVSKKEVNIWVSKFHVNVQSHELSLYLYLINFATLQKMLMAKWKRRTVGYPFDPEQDMDMDWEGEWSSCDYDSDEEHSEVLGDSSEHEDTTEGEDDLDEDINTVELNLGKDELHVDVM